MRGGYPVHVVKMSLYSWPKGVPPTRRTVITGKLEKEYWCVSTKLIGECGHEHATEEEAYECLPTMTARYREARWGSGRKVAPASVGRDDPQRTVPEETEI